MWIDGGASLIKTFDGRCSRAVSTPPCRNNDRRWPNRRPHHPTSPALRWATLGAAGGAIASDAGKGRVKRKYAAENRGSYEYEFSITTP